MWTERRSDANEPFLIFPHDALRTMSIRWDARKQSIPGLTDVSSAKKSTLPAPHQSEAAFVGERSFSKSWGLRASVSFLPLPLTVIPFFWLNFLDELVRKLLLRGLRMQWYYSRKRGASWETVRSSSGNLPCSCFHRRPFCYYSSLVFVKTARFGYRHNHKSLLVCLQSSNLCWIAEYCVCCCNKWVLDGRVQFLLARNSQWNNKERIGRHEISMRRTWRFTERKNWANRGTKGSVTFP